MEEHTSKSKFGKVAAGLEKFRGDADGRHHLPLTDGVFVGGHLD